MAKKTTKKPAISPKEGFGGKKPARRFVVGRLVYRHVFVHTGGAGTVISATKDFCEVVQKQCAKGDRGPVTIYELVPVAGGRTKP